MLSDGRFLMGSINDSRTAIFSSVTNAWTAGPAKSDSSSEETWTLLPDGSVLTAEVNGHPNAERYVPAPNSWVSPGAVPAAADLVLTTASSTEIGPAVLMTDGRLFATGASGHTALYAQSTTGAGVWTAGPDFPLTRTAARGGLSTRRRCCCQRQGALYRGPSRDQWLGRPPVPRGGIRRHVLTVVPDPPNAANSDTWECRLLLLPTGQVLCSSRTADIQLCQPDGQPQSGWAPVITAAPALISPASTFTLQGILLNGLSQANSYGDDAQMATNFPLVRIEMGAHTYYCRTRGFSSFGVATGAAMTSDIVADAIP